MDGLIADPVCVPEAEEAFYAERILRLPHCYQPNDPARFPRGPIPARAEFGLPSKGFVFCCFNNSYKITPSLFYLWMRILRHVEGAVLWLLSADDAVAANLRQEARSRGVAPDRLIFAPRVPQEAHLQRHRVADLFLDTLPYNAHTTGSDALWMGLPVLTCRGASFAGRVGASLLTAAGLPELVAESLEDYQAKAVELASSPGKIAAVKSKLAGNRAIAPLFDMEGYRRAFEGLLIRALQEKG